MKNEVLGVISKMSYDFFIVNLNKDIKCTCINPTTKEADPTCKKCLGTGHKIKIRQIRGASQESQIPSTLREKNEFIIARKYYIPANYLVNEDDIIVDQNNVYEIYRVRPNTGFYGEKVYNHCESVTKKLDKEVFLKNFNEIINR